jgi:flagellar protein FliT
MDSKEVLSLYESVATITHQMLDAARTGDWELLVKLESRCSSHVQMLRNGEPLAPLTGSMRDRKVKIIHRILEDDREIRNITTPWMAQLSAMMKNTGTERKHAKAYGAGQSG